MKPTRPSRIKQLAGIAVIVLALYMVLFSGVRNFAVADAERMLTELSTYLNEEAADRGKEAKLQYSGVEIHGFGYEKWARVIRPSLDLIYRQWQDGERIGLSTESAELHPDPAILGRMSVHFKDTINLIAGSELLAMVKPSQPLLYTFGRRQAKVPSTEHHFTFPGTIHIATPAPRREMQLEFSKPAHIFLSFLKPQHQFGAQFVSPLARLVTDGGTWSAGSSEIRYNSLQKAPRTVESKGTFLIDKITFARTGVTTQPHTATAAWTVWNQRNISGATDKLVLTIEQSLLTDGEMKIVANGTVNFEIDDAPFGEIVVELSHASAFLQSDWIAKDKQALALTLLNDIMGEDMTGHKQAIIFVSREKNGEWKVGKMPLALLLDKGLLSVFIFSGKDRHDESSDQAS